MTIPSSSDRLVFLAEVDLDRIDQSSLAPFINRWVRKIHTDLLSSKPGDDRPIPAGWTSAESACAIPDNHQLADGVDRILVESLSSPFVDERSLAIYQLQMIMGKEHGYQSDRPSHDSLQRWKQMLNTAKIRLSK